MRSREIEARSTADMATVREQSRALSRPDPSRAGGI